MSESEQQPKPKHLKPTEWEWWAGDNDEFYNLGSFESKERAIAEVRAHGCGGSVVEARFTPLDLSDHFDIDLWFNELSENVYPDHLTDHGCIDIADYSEGQQKELEAEIKAVISAWQARHCIIVQGDIFSDTRNRVAISETGEIET